MAGSAFKDAEILKLLEDFVPILVDGDVEKEVTKRFGVNGYPDTKFLDKKQKVLETVGGYVEKDRFKDAVEGARKKVGKIVLSADYKKLLEASAKLKAALEKSRYKDALRAIKAIEDLKHEGPDLDAARAAGTEIAAVAAQRMTEAEAVVAEDPKKAKSLYLKIVSEFDGIEAAKEARKRAAAIE